MVNFKASKGDLVRILPSAELCGADVRIGDIVEIGRVDVWEGVCTYYAKTVIDAYGDNLELSDDEFELFRKVGEEDDEEEARQYCEYCTKELGGESVDGDFCSDDCAAMSLPVEEPSDPVHHPSHYKQGRFETIEIIEEVAKGYDNGYVAYCVGNSLKYLSRAPFKHETPIEDLRKAATYLDFAIKAYEAKEGE